MDVFIRKEYATAVYDSCKGLYVPSTNEYVMDILCGQPVVSCSPKIWLSYLGSVDAFSPLQINYIFVDQNRAEALSTKTYGCNETPTVIKKKRKKR